jgi:hypothetical protein
MRTFMGGIDAPQQSDPRHHSIRAPDEQFYRPDRYQNR